MNALRLHIAMAVPGMRIGPDSIGKGSIGGSETAGVQLAQAFARAGHLVTIFGNCAESPEIGGVSFRPIAHFAGFVACVPHDVTIVQRAPSMCMQQIESRLQVLWMHDMALRRSAKEMHGCLWNVDAVAVLSAFHEQQYREIYGLDERVLWRTRNGIDLGLFPRRSDPDHNIMVYGARPERGLDLLLRDIWPRILQRSPEARLKICTYNNPVEHLAGFYAECRRLSAHAGMRGSVEWLGSLTKADLYSLYGRAGLYLYPTPSQFAPEFREISCISAMECQAMGLPIVASAAGALLETIAPGAGALVEPGDNFADRFTDEVMRLMNSSDEWSSASAIGKRAAIGMGWDSIAAEWLAMFEKKRAEHNSDPARLARHLARRSDIMAARAIGDAVPGDISVWIEKEFSFIDSADLAREHYRKIGLTHTDCFESAGSEPRLRELIRWVSGREDVVSVLDVGCAHGAYAVHLVNGVPRISVDGVDHDKHSIEWAERYREQHSARKDALRFFEDEIFRPTGKYDCLLLCEVLEHVAEPWALAGQYEKHVRPGGWVYITVPRGPWEHMSYRTYPHRCHVWEFDHHDIEEMFGRKKRLSVAYMGSGRSSLTDDPIGWYVITYQAGEAKTGKIRINRKLAYQRPRQSVSASIIAGPGVEQTLLWCLDPLRDIVDEIIVADNGLSETAIRLLADTGARVVPGADPMRVGFDVSRNLALDECRMDWVLWIDTDERLVSPEKLGKYLRANRWNGYGIRQHHFAVDTKFEPDMPVRLYRRNTADGKSMRHIGCLAGDTLIDMPGRQAAIRDLAGQQPLVYAYDVEEKALTIAKASRVWLTRPRAPVLAIELDDGSIIRATPDHRFLMRRGRAGARGFKEAMDLQPGDSLMPLHRHIHHGYSQIRVRAMDYRPEHRFIHETLNGPVPEGWIVHHADHDRANNDPRNLVAMDAGAHSSMHNTGRTHSEDTRQLIADNHAPCDGEKNSMYGRIHSEETRALIGKRSRERNAGRGNSEVSWFTPESASAGNKISWLDPVIRAKRISGIKEAAARRRRLKADNHKVVSVRDGGFADVYDMEVPGPHTFVACGVVVHNCVHEHPELGMNEGPGPVIVISDVHIAHVGYLDEAGRQRRYWRNLPLLRMDIRDYPDRGIQKHFIMRDNCLLARYILASNGGVVNESVAALCEEAIALYRKHFRGRPTYVNVDSLAYYSEALRILGRGIDVEMAVRAERPGVMNGKGTRFENEEDLRAELDWRVKEAVSPLLETGY